MNEWHRITNVNIEEARGDCSVCGPGVRLAVRIRGASVKRTCLLTVGKHKKFREQGAAIEAARKVANGRCMICGTEAELVRDHDHTTNRFRGWLCHHCNVGLGFFADDPDRLTNAVAYLRHATT